MLILQFFYLSVEQVVHERQRIIVAWIVDVDGYALNRNFLLNVSSRHFSIKDNVLYYQAIAVELLKKVFSFSLLAFNS